MTVNAQEYDAPQQPPLREVVAEIVAKNRAIARFWSTARGWAPTAAAELLSQSRLDLQVELSLTLNLWLDAPDPKAPDYSGRLILAWANLGALVEGTLMWFLSVFHADYSSSADRCLVRNSEKLPVDRCELDRLRVLCRNEVWVEDERDLYDAWILDVQRRRNAIHAYRKRDLGSFPEFFAHVRTYREFLMELDRRIPYPEETG